MRTKVAATLSPFRHSSFRGDQRPDDRQAACSRCITLDRIVRCAGAGRRGAGRPSAWAAPPCGARAAPWRITAAFGAVTPFPQFVDALESKVDRLERLCREGEAAGVVSADQRRAFARKVAQLQAFVQRRVRAVALRSGTAAPDDAAIAGAVRQVSSPTAFVASHTTPAPLEPIAVPDLAEPELAVAGPRARSVRTRAPSPACRAYC